MTYALANTNNRPCGVNLTKTVRAPSGGKERSCAHETRRSGWSPFDCLPLVSENIHSADFLAHSKRLLNCRIFQPSSQLFKAVSAIFIVTVVIGVSLIAGSRYGNLFGEYYKK